MTPSSKLLKQPPLKALELSKPKPTKNTVRFKAINIVTKSLRIIVTKTNRNSIRIKIKNRITKSLKITNNKIQRISAINCNRIGSRTQTLIVGIKSSNSATKVNRKSNNNCNRKCLRIYNRNAIRINLCYKSFRKDRRLHPRLYSKFLE